MSIENLIPPPVLSSSRPTYTPPLDGEISLGSHLTDPSRVESPGDHTYPPVPAYDSLYPSNDINPDVQATSPEETEAADDIHQYTLAHDHAGTGVAPRLPESFPSDLFSLRSSQGQPETLPAYGFNDPPGYTRRIENHPQEPETLAMHFFKFGFFFPAFWVFGALMLITPLRSPNPLSPVAQLSVWPPNSTFVAWCNENVRTEEDKEEFLARMQQVEMKWARRCLLALGMLLCFAVAIGVTIFAVLKVKNL